MMSSKNLQKSAYKPEDLAGLDYHNHLGDPGSPPYVRGIYEEMYQRRLWSIRQFSGFGTPEQTNERFKYEHSIGQTGLSIAFDVITYAGLDSDDEVGAMDVGQSGVPISSLEDMETAFDGLPIEQLATAVVTSPITACPLTAMYFAVAEKRGINLKELNGTTQNDIITFQASCNYNTFVSPKNQLRLSVDFIEWCAQNVPKWHPVSFASYNYRENSITAAEELGFLFAEVREYIDEELRRDRMRFDDFVPTFSFHLASHNDILEEVAKFRAARRMWHKFLKERYDNENPANKFRIHVQTSGSTHTYQQPLNNIVRIAYQTLAAALGGVQSIHANSYDEALCLPTEESLLISVRTQQIAQCESGVTKVADPLGGSYYVEALTDEVEQQAWQFMEEIEKFGGVMAALESGWVHNMFTKAMMDYEKELATGETKIVGVNCYKMDEEIHQVPHFRLEPGLAAKRAEKVRDLKRRRNNQKVASTLKELRRATEAGENVMPATIQAVNAYATVQEICDVWRDIYGVWIPPVAQQV
jgi:methylmalonyl-CoA mutase N-terminal domain/subunit